MVDLPIDLLSVVDGLPVSLFVLEELSGSDGSSGSKKV